MQLWIVSVRCTAMENWRIYHQPIVVFLINLRRHISFMQCCTSPEFNYKSQGTRVSMLVTKSSNVIGFFGIIVIKLRVFSFPFFLKVTLWVSKTLLNKPFSCCSNCSIHFYPVYKPCPSFHSMENSFFFGKDGLCFLIISYQTSIDTTIAVTFGRYFLLALWP